MTFLLSKLLWLLAKPSHILLLALLAGSVLLFSRRRAGRMIVAVVALLSLAVVALPVGDWMAAPLENRFPVPSPMPARVDGIVVLGGGLKATGRHVGLNGAGDRLLGLLQLARLYPDAMIVYTGGSALIEGGPREADLARKLLHSVGFAAERVRFERDARNTHENATFSKRLVRPAAGETWLLVTSAMHMPRAVGTFREVDWPVVPFPVDYQVDPDEPLQYRFDFPANLLLLDAAAHEWLGLAAYRWLHYTATLFPGPR